MRAILVALLFAVGVLLNAQATQIYTGIGPLSGPPSAGDTWYGQTLSTSLIGVPIYIQDQGTWPFYQADSMNSSGMRAPSPFLYPLSTTASYHNAVMYGFALTGSNVVRTDNLLLAQAKNTKEGGDPLLGKSPTSLSFWQWLKLGEMALKTYGKMSAIVKALHAGQVTIDIWKLVPKINVINEDNPSAPMLVMGLVPSSQGAIALAKDITNLNDPRYYLGNKINFDELSTLVPSLGVKPSFFGAYAHMATADPSDRDTKMMSTIQRNFHEMRTALSMLQRGLIGKSRTEADIERSRFSTAYANKVAAKMQARSNWWTTTYGEIQSGARYFGPDLSGQIGAMSSNYSNMQAREVTILTDTVGRKAAETWKAKRVAGNLSNVTVPLETEEYADGIEKIQALVTEYASEDNNHQAYDDEKVLIGLAAADAWTNKLIHDELRALRHIYTMQIQREAQEKLAPFIAQSYQELQAGAERLGRLNRLLAQMQAGQTANTAFFNGDDIARLAKKLDTP